MNMRVSSSPIAPVIPPITDTALVMQLWQGDLNALGVLYDRYSSLVYTLALRSLGNVASAEDLTQDVFLTLMNSRTYDPDRGSLSSYLSLLTRSRAIDRLRAQSTQHKYLNQWQRHPQPAEPSPMEHASQQERHTLVREALDQLSQQQRQVLELSYYQGQSQTEIAAQLGVPLGTVKSWARRGLLRLRSHLENQLNEE
ncbi:MAG: sigma-70 family RNA polymerase sigma factor [Leptolyngbya sp. SIO1D8]|nr:sigma-70 family RNA polymerase sigma factor [Leptolyngbya sp. SIO1D8]